jgi:predicted DNA-binding transcriptional regulator AlpA
MAEFLKFHEVQARLGCSRATLYRLIKAGALTPYYRAVRRNSPIFAVSQVDSLMTPRLREPAR